MPLLVLFRGRPVKHRRRTSEGLRITFVNPLHSQPGDVAVVTQEDWLRHGTLEFFSPQMMPDVRVLAARFEHPAL